MSNVRAVDMIVIDDVFEMNGGYVLNFSDRTFARFLPSYGDNALISARTRSSSLRRKCRIVPKWLWTDRALNLVTARAELPVVSICRMPRFLIFRNLLDSIPKSGVSSVTSRLDTRGVSRSSRNAGWDAVDAAALGVRWDRGAD
jgi:hypothetical protein